MWVVCWVTRAGNRACRTCQGVATAWYREQIGYIAVIRLLCNTLKYPGDEQYQMHDIYKIINKAKHSKIKPQKIFVQHLKYQSIFHCGTFSITIGPGYKCQLGLFHAVAPGRGPVWILFRYSHFFQKTKHIYGTL